MLLSGELTHHLVIFLGGFFLININTFFSLTKIFILAKVSYKFHV